MKKITLLFSFIAATLFTYAQVAINSNGANSNASAMLDISSSNKGLLIPRVYLTSSVDNITIANPAISLLVYNTNVNLNKGVGFYYNSGTAASPNWQAVQDLVLPFTKSVSDNSAAFTIANYSQNTASSAIKAVGGGAGNALEVSGKMKIAGNGQDPAQGKVLTSDANGNATWEGAVAFSATGIVNTGSQSIGTTTFTKIRFANVNYDLSGDYTGPNAANNNVFTVPVNGVYHFDAMITWDANYVDGNSARFYLVRMRNGNRSELVRHVTNFPDYPILIQQINTDVQLQAGDQIYLEVYHNVSTNMVLSASQNENYFNGRLVIKL